MKKEYTQIRVSTETRADLHKIANDTVRSMHDQIRFWIKQEKDNKDNNK